MTDRTEIFLAVIAVATLAMAIAQLGIVVVAGLAGRRAARVMATVEQELKPGVSRLDAIGRDASKAAALAVVQVERADKLFADVAARVEHALTTVQTTIEAPAREGKAVLSGVRAALDALRDLRRGTRSRHGRGDDEDALFI